MDRRTATCACGQLVFVARGAPVFIALCHCEACQRRTGSTHQVAAWFASDHVEHRSGDFKVFERVGDLGMTIRFEFCGDCGSTVSWTTVGTSNTRAIAAGCFADPSLPKPEVELFTSRRHPWMRGVDGVPQFETQPSGSDGESG